MLQVPGCMTIISVILLATIIGDKTSTTNAADIYETSKPQSRQLLEAPEFRLLARIRAVKINTWKFYGEIVSQEFYSNEQKRARIELHDAYRNATSRVSNAKSIFFYDDSKRRLIKQTLVGDKSLRDRRSSHCQLSSSKQLGRDLLYEVLRGREEDGIDWLKKQDGIPDHVVGAARLLFYVDKKRSSLKEIIEERKVSIRNHEVVRYNLIGGLKEISSKIEGIRVSYPKSANHKLMDDLPLRLVLILSTYEEILIDYSLIGPMADDHAADDDDESSGRNALDMFALPVGINCTAQLNEDGLWSFDTSMDVSFQVETIQYDHNDDNGKVKTSSLGKRFVAYDGHASLMRSDSLLSDDDDNDNDGAHSTTILDFSQQVKFNILTIDATSKSDTRRESACVSAQVSNPIAYYTFLNWPSLVPVGGSTIRGVACSAFEQITDRLPASLFPQLTYQDRSGTFRSTFFVLANQQQGTSYNIIYHFAAHSSGGQRAAARPLMADNQPLGPLMRVDVYMNSRLRYRLEVLDFVYELVDAPNGDRRDELFSLRDRCTSGKQGNDAFASISIKMKALPEESGRPQASDRSLEETARLLKSPSARNNAIMRAISMSTRGIMKSIYDLSSRLKLIPDQASATGHTKKLEVYATGRLSVHDVGLTIPKQIGYVAYTMDRSEIFESFEDCFFRAAHRAGGGGGGGGGGDKGGVARFASCSNWCSYDTNPVIDESADGSSISAYRSDRLKIKQEPHPASNSCPVFLIETRAPTADEQKQQFFGTFRNAYQSLKDLTMPMQIPFDREAAKDQQQVMYFKVEQVEIENDRWSVSEGFERADSTSDGSSSRRGGETIDGIGLTEVSGTLQDDGSRTEMSQEYCRSQCMSLMKCQSFSICLTGRGIECIMSEVSFRDDTLLERIEAKRNELKEMKNRNNAVNGKQIQVPLLVAESEGAQTMETVVELKVDLRCRLYKKNVLELFHKLKPTEILVKSQRTTSLRSVGSLEKCAELCLRNNLIFFRKMEKFEKSLLDGGDENQLKDESVLRKLRDEYQKNLQTWCSSLKYLNLVTSSEAEQIRPLLDPNKDSDRNQGLCLLNTPAGVERAEAKSPVDDLAAPNGSLKIRFETYGYRYSNLYKAQFGVQLRGTGELDGKDSRLRNVVELMPARDPEWCATMCFLQTDGPEPGCKSFDFVEPGRAMSYCALNSVTLGQIERNNLTEMMVFDRTQPGRDDDNFKVWHHEPRSFSIENAMLAAKKLTESQEDLRTSRLAESHTKGFGIALIVLVAFVCSLTMTLMCGPKILDKWSSPIEQQRRDSVSNPTRSILDTFADVAESTRQNISNRLLTGSSQNHNDHHIEIAELDITGKPVS